MPRYSEERKAAVLKMLPLHNQSVPEVAESEGISQATLYNWRNQNEQIRTKSERHLYQLFNFHSLAGHDKILVETTEPLTYTRSD